MARNAAFRGGFRNPGSTSSTATATISTRPSACRGSASSGLGDELVVAPYATALASMVDPGRAAQNFRRLSREGAEGAYGFYESVDYTHRKGTESEPGSAPAPSAPRGVVVQAYLAHHQGMSLVALANTLLGDVMVRRFHADPRVQATALLLQERVPRHAPISQHPAEETRAVTAIAPATVRRFRSPHTRFPHAQFLSNGAYVAVVTNAGGGASLCRGRAVTRYREDATRDLGSQFLYLRDVRSESVWSAAYHPTGREPEEYLVTYQPERAVIRPEGRGHRDPARHRGVHRGRRRGAPPRGDQPERPPPGAGDHELRRDRAGVDRRRPGAPGVRQALRGDGVPGGEFRPALWPPAPLAGGGRRLGGPRAERRGPDAGAGGMGDRSPPIPGSGQGVPRIPSRSMAVRCRARWARCWIRS